MDQLNLTKIKSKRKALNITMQDMAQVLGFKHASTYLKYENGVSAFKADHVPLLANKLNMEIHELYFFNQNIAKSAIE